MVSTLSGDVGSVQKQYAQENFFKCIEDNISIQQQLQNMDLMYYIISYGCSLPSPSPESGSFSGNFGSFSAFKMTNSHYCLRKNDDEYFYKSAPGQWSEIMPSSTDEGFSSSSQDQSSELSRPWQWTHLKDKWI